MNATGKCLLRYLTDCEESRAALRAVYARIRAEGTADMVFYDGTVTCEQEFIADMLRPGSLPFLVYWKGKEAGFTWFNSIEGKSARGHFVIYRDFWGRAISAAMGREACTYILTRKDDYGYLFDVIVGLTPVHNPLAWRLALMCGAREVGVIPHGAYMAKTGKTEGAKLTVVTREILGLEGAAV